MVYIVKLLSDKPDYMSTVDWFPKINTVVQSQVQMCDAEASGTDLTETSGIDFAERLVQISQIVRQTVCTKRYDCI